MRYPSALCCRGSGGGSGGEGGGGGGCSVGSSGGGGDSGGGHHSFPTGWRRASAPAFGGVVGRPRGRLHAGPVAGAAAEEGRRTVCGDAVDGTARGAAVVAANPTDEAATAASASGQCNDRPPRVNVLDARKHATRVGQPQIRRGREGQPSRHRRPVVV